MHFSAAGEEPSAGLGEESETRERESETTERERVRRESVKEEKSGGEENLWCMRV
jgi:hypothetical protein